MGVQLAARLRRTALAAVLAMGVLALSGCIEFYEDELDPGLIRQLETHFSADRDRAAAAIVEADRLHTGYVNADEGTVFEVGSITKLVTGLLLPIAVERGEVALDDPVGRYLPLGDAPVAARTLEQLATHRAGLPPITTDEELLTGIRVAVATGGALPPFSVAGLLELAAAESAEPSERAVYSSLGAALLGHALAAGAGTDYASLLRDRILEPLGMDGADVPADPGEVASAHADGYTSRGDPAEAWTGAGWGPTFGMHATLPDLVALARAILSGPFADSPALEPMADGPNSQQHMGYLWFLARDGDRTLTGTRAITSGFAAALFVDREAGQAVVVLSNEAEHVDRFAVSLLDGVSGAGGWRAGDP
ncbi:serine hydrolase domain-containing protein [Agromyces sp. SYSU T00266]|uniref:serine hydrolase domain-containing protein n=1 Tax=Agromyces zhanjiangensis TaxID=3158562 RepID=UPI003392BC56